MKIGVDLDGLVVEFHEWFINNHNKINNTALTLDDWTDYEFSNAGYTMKSLGDVINAQAMHGDFLLPDPVKGAVEGLRELSERNSIHIITYRKYRARQDAVEWLDNHQVPFDSISFAKDKAKAGLILGIDTMIEDDWSSAISTANAGIDTILYNRPYNKGITPKLITRVYDWNEILNVIELNSRRMIKASKS